MLKPKTGRRLAAVLAADVVGYTRLMGRDEAGTHARLKAIRRELVDPSVKRHGGRVVKSTGDGVLAEFPSAVEAAACAVEVQRAMLDRNAGVPVDKRIVFRVGLNVGDLIIDDGDIFGDGVNVAARLESLCVPGGVCISRAVRDQIRDKAPHVFEDLGEQSVKNIERPVRAFHIRLEAVASEPLQSSARPSGSWRPPGNLRPQVSALIRAAIGAVSASKAGRAWTGVTVLLALAGGAGAWWFSIDRSPPHNGSSIAEAVRSPPVVGRASIAVLPFASPTVDGSNDYFADGLTEDIIAALGRFRDLTVISRSGVFAYKGKNPTSDEVGRALKVRYIAEGSVRRNSDRVRVTVSLTDTSRHALLWSEKYDVELKDVFSVQDQITRQITGALAVRVSALELSQAAAKPPRNLEAYDLVLRGRDLLSRVTRSANARARSVFERAIELDPSYGAAYVGLGRVDLSSAIQGWAADPSAALERAEALARKAISFDDQNPGAHALLGLAVVNFGEYDRALAELRRAVNLNPSDPDAHGGLLNVLLWAGDLPGTIAAGEFLARIQPNINGGQALALGMAYVLSDRAEDAIRILEAAIDDNRTVRPTNAILAAAYVQAGRKDQAAEKAQIVRAGIPFRRDEFGSLLRDANHREKLGLLFSEAGL